MRGENKDREFFKDLAKKCIEPRQCFEQFTSKERDILAGAVADTYIIDTIPALVRMLASTLMLVRIKGEHNEGD